MTLSPLTVRRGDFTLALPALDFSPGKVYAVIGANGSGKSTLARVLAGLPGAEGGVLSPAGLSVGYLPQRPYAFRGSVRRNLLLNGGDETRCDELLAALHLDHLASHRAPSLSGGECARMALARLLMRRYDLLVLDEPTAAMDQESTLLSEDLLRAYREETRCAVLLITHSLGQARRCADEVLYLEHGELLERGEITALDAPATDALRRFLDF